LRRKIFLILFIGIGLFTVITTSELVFILKNERSRTIDQKVELLASSLLATGIFESRFEEVQAEISRALGTRETITIISVYDRFFNLRYRNSNGQILFGKSIVRPVDKWMTLNEDGHRVRILNLRTELGGNWIQVGVLVDEENEEWNIFAARAYIITFVLLLGVAIASFFISKALLRPLSELAHDMRAFSRDLEGNKKPEKIFSKWTKQSKEKDAFTELVDSILELRARLVGRLKMNDATLSQMAHELKTPLSVIRVSAESLYSEITEEENKEQIEEILLEVDRLSDTITSFLKWSRFQQVEVRELAVVSINLSETIKDVASSLAHLYPERLSINLESNFSLKADRAHLEQCIFNITSNALKYSTDKVHIVLKDDLLSVSDSGTGIPEKVLMRLGEPFNSGAKGTGLGLAWVRILCDRYAWKLDLQSKDTGTTIKIQFSNA
jgi:signal transduction histidine kinase